jgi:hypothetical protein
MKKILLGGILGGIAMFVASSIIHIATPLGHAGLSTLPEDPAIERFMKEKFPKEDGLYFFPGGEMNKRLTDAELAAWEAKVKAAPAGMVLYHPNGGIVMAPVLLVKEFISDIVLALIAAFIVSLTVASFGQRVILVTLLGFLAWIAISFSHLNWYGFPLNFELAELVDQVAGFLLCGIILAWLYRSHRATA